MASSARSAWAGPLPVGEDIEGSTQLVAVAQGGGDAREIGEGRIHLGGLETTTREVRGHRIRGKVARHGPGRAGLREKRTGGAQAQEGFVARHLDEAEVIDIAQRAGGEERELRRDRGGSAERRARGEDVEGVFLQSGLKRLGDGLRVLAPEPERLLPGVGTGSARVGPAAPHVEGANLLGPFEERLAAGLDEVESGLTGRSPSRRASRRAARPRRTNPMTDAVR